MASVSASTKKAQKAQRLPSVGGSVSRFVHKLYDERSQRIVIGFTGRTGSGCTTAAELLTALRASTRIAVEHTPGDIHDRKDRIIARFASENWVPFSRLSVTALIAGFLLEEQGDIFLAFAEASRLIGAGGRQLPQEAAQQVAATIDRYRKEYLPEIQRTATEILPPQGKTQLHAKFFLEIAPAFLSEVKDYAGNAYIPLFQALGDNCRKFGKTYEDVEGEQHVFAIAKRVKYAVDVIDAHMKLANLPCYLTMDAVRNPYEADWLKQHISGFYLVAVNTPDRDRRARLQELGLTSVQISGFDAKEYPSEGKDPPKGFAKIISQNIQTCIEKADIHLTNPGFTAKGEKPDTSILSHALTKYVSLMQHPGLVTPTRDERCMQVAFAAKTNSGCISRQVGATLTDSEGAIISVGWNDVPKGQVPCLLRDRTDLFQDKDRPAFSHFERLDADFSAHLKKKYVFENRTALKGRSMQYCFREAYNSKTGESNQVHTRSLHAEENAFLQLAKFGTRLPPGSVLYTSASPCELCAKKAYQLGVKSIFYIDPYPGISLTHIFGSGDNSPAMHLYTGAIGPAYHRLYDPLMPLKDELNYIMSESDPRPILEGLALD